MDPEEIMRRHAWDSLKLIVAAAIVTACSVPLTAQLSRDSNGPLDCNGCSQQTQGIEPGAGTWKTWVIPSGDALRLPPPPSGAQSRAELVELRNVTRDAAAMDRVRYWDAGAPGMRWGEIAVAE